MQVDNWLSEHGLEHMYEPLLDGTSYRADFLVNEQYIEVWGIHGNARYDRRRDRKLKVYERLRLPLVSVYPDDFPHLDVLSILLS